jgi:hypothetical protein
MFVLVYVHNLILLALSILASIPLNLYFNLVVRRIMMKNVKVTIDVDSDLSSE